MAPEIESKVKFNFTMKKALIVDLILVVILLCAFFAGYFTRDRLGFTKTQKLCRDYIEKACSCYGETVNGARPYLIDIGLGDT